MVKAPFPLAFSHFGPGAPESPALARPEWSHPEGKPTVIRGYHGILYIYLYIKIDRYNYIYI